MDKYAVLGNPVSHSMSPLLHKFFAETTNEELTYEAILVENGEFEKTLDDFFAHGGKGCNITVPCKLDAYKYADTLTVYAQKARAVNTLKLCPDNTVIGDNTDGRGLVADLMRLQAEIKAGNILIIGAGGAAQGIIQPLLNEEPKLVTVANRTFEKAQKLADDYDERVEASSFDALDNHYDLIINATSSSLKGELPKISPDIIRGASLVYDLMYSKDGSTVFTRKAMELGVGRAYDGFGMLVGQAILSFELWRGVRPDFEKALKKFGR